MNRKPDPTQRWFVVDEERGDLGPFTLGQLSNMEEMGSITLETELHSGDGQVVSARMLLRLGDAPAGDRSRRLLVWGGALVAVMILVAIWAVFGSGPQTDGTRSSTAPVPLAAETDVPHKDKNLPTPVSSDGRVDAKIVPTQPGQAPAAATGTAASTKTPALLTGWQPLAGPPIITLLGPPDAFALRSIRREDAKRLKFPFDDRESGQHTALLIRFPDATYLRKLDKRTSPHVRLSMATGFSQPSAILRMHAAAPPNDSNGQFLDDFESSANGLSGLMQDEIRSSEPFVLMFLVPRWIAKADLQVKDFIGERMRPVSIPLEWPVSDSSDPGADGWSIVTLPERYDAVASAAGGKLLVFHPSGSGLLRIYDVRQRRLDRQLSIPVRDILLGANSTHALVLDRISHRLITVRLSDGQMSDGLDVSAHGAVDQIEEGNADGQADLVRYEAPRGYPEEGVQREVISIVLADGRVVGRKRHPLNPKPTGHGGDLNSGAPGMFPIGPGTMVAPARDNPSVLMLVGEGGQMEERAKGTHVYSLFLGYFPGFNRLQPHQGIGHTSAWRDGELVRSHVIPTERRVLLFADQQHLCCLPVTNQHVLHRGYDRAALLEKSMGINVIVPTQQLIAVKNTRLQHQFTQVSRWSEVAWALEKVPAGMEMTPTGLLTWTVTDLSADGTQSKILVSVTPTGGKRTTHTVRLIVLDESNPMAKTKSPSTTGLSGSADPQASLARDEEPASAQAPEQKEIPPGDVISSDGIRLTDERIDVTATRDGKYTLVLHYDRLFHFDAAGRTHVKTVPLQRPYERIADRGNYLVALRGDGLDLLDRDSGKILRAIELPGGGTIDFALHPQQPLTYVSLVEVGGDARDLASAFKIICVQEKDGVIRRSKDAFGLNMAISPDGKMLYTILAAHCLESFPLVERFSLRSTSDREITRVSLLIAYRLNGSEIQPHQHSAGFSWHPSDLPELVVTPDSNRLILGQVTFADDSRRTASSMMTMECGAFNKPPLVIAIGKYTNTCSNVVMTSGGGIVRMDGLSSHLLHVDMEDAEAVPPRRTASSENPAFVKSLFAAASGQDVMLLERRREDNQDVWYVRSENIPEKQAKGAGDKRPRK